MKNLVTRLLVSSSLSLGAACGHAEPTLGTADASSPMAATTTAQPGASAVATAQPGASAVATAQPGAGASAMVAPGTAVAPGPAAEPEAIAVSDDGRSEVFARGVDLWLRTAGDDDALLVRGDGSLCVEPVAGLACVPVREPFGVEFYPDGRRVAFSSAPGRGENVFALELATRKVSWIGWAFGYEHILIREGPWAGHFLLASTHGCSLVHGTTGRLLRDVSELDRECFGAPALRRALRFRLACYDLARDVEPFTVERCATTMAACEATRLALVEQGFVASICRME